MVYKPAPEDYPDSVGVVWSAGEAGFCYLCSAGVEAGNLTMTSLAKENCEFWVVNNVMFLEVVICSTLNTFVFEVIFPRNTTHVALGSLSGSGFWKFGAFREFQAKILSKPINSHAWISLAIHY